MRLDRLIKANSYLKTKIERVDMDKYTIEQKASFKVKAGLEFLDKYLELRCISKDDLKKINGCKSITKKEIYNFFLNEMKENEMDDVEV
jgi:hypothetical protein